MPGGVFITGASSGIGAAHAAHYADTGATLGLVARRADGLCALAGRLGSTTATYAADVADHAAMREAAADFIARHGVPDIVIANAAVSVGTLGSEPEDLPVLERILRTNVVGLAATLTPFVAPMRERKGGILTGIASIAGFRGLPGSGAYSASKAAAIAWLESLRVELAGSGVAVVTVCPGFIDTPMTRVNRYRMPFLLGADEAARRIARAIDARRAFVVVPWQMALAGRLWRALPNWLYDALAARGPRKPRNLPL
ncbi:MAG TPA: SDR family oxidoreductase [Burkholderiales bacterium]|nr:SDR family oxidoreductase [Burkholderiales bacterium]